MNDVKQDDNEYIVEKPICCSVGTFLWTNFLWSVISVGLVVFGILGIVLQSNVFVVLPPAAYFTAIGIGGFGVLVILMGVIGQKQSIELCFLLYILLVSLGLIAQTLAYCYLLLYANDVSTISTLDKAAINAQDAFENNLKEYAFSEPAKWAETQDKLGCCGIDFEAGIDLGAADLAILESGKECSVPDKKTALDNLRAQATGFKGDEFEPAAEDPEIGRGTGFFCKDKISQFMVQNTPFIAAALCVILLVQISALVSASRMYWVPEYLGGWQFDEGDMEEVAKRKGIAMPQTAGELGTGIGSQVRAAGQRLSFRFKNAFTADPDIPEREGILGRLSMRRTPAMGNQLSFGQPNAQYESAAPSGFGQPNPAFAPSSPKSPPPPGMLKRLSGRVSNRMLQSFGGAMMSMPKGPKEPPGPPPGFAPVEDLSGGPTRGMSGPRQPAGPPPSFGMPGPAPTSMGLDQFYATAAPPQPQRSATKRISARLQAGINTIGGAFKFSAPPQPPVPPSFGSSNNLRQMGGNSMNMGGGMGAGGLPGPNAGFGMPSGAPSGPPPPNTFMMDSNSNLNRSGGLALPKMPSNNALPQARAPMTSMPQTRAPMTSISSMPATRPPLSSMPKANAPAPAGKKSGIGGMSFGMGGRGTKAGGATKKVSNVTGGPPAAAIPAGRGGLLAQIQAGTRLKHAVTDDRSGPAI